MVAALALASVVGVCGAALAMGNDDGGDREDTPPVAAPSGPSHVTAPATPLALPTECTQADAIEAMPIRRRLAQTLMVGVDPSGPAGAVAAVRDQGIGAVFIPGNETGLLNGGLAEVHRASEIPVAVAVDDEGGRVQRIDDLDGDLPSAREMAATMNPEQVYDLARKRGDALRARGVTMDLAPIVDVSSQPDDAVIGDRAFSDDPGVVTRYAGEFARGLADAGIMPVLKHFPGHGRSSGDSHQGTVSTPSLDDLRNYDLVPYRELARGVPAVMLGHLQVPGLTEPDTPASLSPATVALLRGEYGFSGLVMSDDLVAMKAISARVDLPVAVERALAAGVDMALWITPTRIGEVLDHLERAVADGRLSQARVDEAVGRVLAAKQVDLCGGR